MPRTDADMVRAIGKFRDTVDLTAYIADANSLVTEICVPPRKADGVTQFHSDERLTRIETWLAAHFAATNYRRATQEQAGSVMASYEGKVDLGLDVTEFGQQAKRLDTSGQLAALDNAMKTARMTLPAGSSRKKITWLGTEQ